MMADEGFYSSEEELLFQRVHLLWRAVRIILDVGLHTRGMTFEQAVDQLVDLAHLDRTNAEAEVRRYCAEPAYQLCYAVGRRELLRLRDDYRTARGADFTDYQSETKSLYEIWWTFGWPYETSVAMAHRQIRSMIPRLSPKQQTTGVD